MDDLAGVDLDPTDLPKFQRMIAGALRNCIDAHGPITKEWTGSAAKRVASALLSEQIRHDKESNVTKAKAICPRCSVDMTLRLGKFGKFYGCPNFPGCDYAQSCNAGGVPIGLPVDGETRKARIAAHKVFDRLWERGHSSRAGAYRWLQSVLGLDKNACHISLMDLETCNRVIAAVRDTFPEESKDDPPGQA